MTTLASFPSGRVRACRAASTSVGNSILAASPGTSNSKVEPPFDAKMWNCLCIIVSSRSFLRCLNWSINSLFPLLDASPDAICAPTGRFFGPGPSNTILAEPRWFSSAPIALHPRPRGRSRTGRLVRSRRRRRHHVCFSLTVVAPTGCLRSRAARIALESGERFW
jgi:hypothetical protein